MGEGLNILLLSFLPAAIYSLIIFFTVPYKKINLGTSFMYLFVGFITVGFLKYFWLAIPEWKDIAITLSGEDSDPFTYYHNYYFIQVGFAEELSKLAVFLIIDRYRRMTMKIKDHPLATMFYVGMVSLGFAVVENIHYGMYSSNPEVTLYWRSFTSVIGHMVFGLFMGYWISLGRLGPRLNNRSLFDLLVNKKKRVRNTFYTLVGLLSATTLHGLYDLHIQFNKNSGITMTYLILGMSLLGAYWCFRHLNITYNKKIKDKENI